MKTIATLVAVFVMVAVGHTAIAAVAPKAIVRAERAEVLRTDGSVWHWGKNNLPMENGNYVPVLTVTQVAIDGVVNIAATVYNSFAWQENGAGWLSGQQAGFYPPSNVPYLPGSDLVGLVDVHNGMMHDLALAGDGSIWGWGSNFSGQLGTQSFMTRAGMVFGAGTAVSIAAGDMHSVYLAPNGTVWSFGENNVGQFGDGTTINSSLPVMASGLTGVVGIDAVASYTVVAADGGRVWLTGRHNYIPPEGDCSLPVPCLVAGIDNITAVAAGREHILMLKSDKTVWALGTNFSGQLGDNTTESKSLPVQVLGLSNVIAISADSDTSMAVTADGTVWSWGADNFNQSGTSMSGAVNQSAINMLPVAAPLNLDATAPSVTLTLGESDGAALASLSCEDNMGVCTIHYTLNGDSVSCTSAPYLLPLVLQNETTLHYIACDGAGNSSSDQESLIVAPEQLKIQYVLDIVGLGSVNFGDGSSCDDGSTGGGCSKTVDKGTTLILTAVGEFISWSGCDTVLANTCTVTINTARTTTARFGTIPAFLSAFVDGSYFATVTEAIFAATAGSIVKLIGGAVFGSLNLNSPVPIVLAGGYDNTFTNRAGGVSTITGELVIAAGSVTVDGIVIK